MWIGHVGSVSPGPPNDPSPSRPASTQARARRNHGLRNDGAREGPGARGTERCPVTKAVGTTIAHVSNIHVGAHDDVALDGLAGALSESGAAATIVTGDLTMRARRAEFARAKDVIDQFPAPTMVVLGNHDISLTNPFRRMSNPYGRFRTHVTDALTRCSTSVRCASSVCSQCLAGDGSPDGCRSVRQIWSDRHSSTHPTAWYESWRFTTHPHSRASSPSRIGLCSNEPSSKPRSTRARWPHPSTKRSTTHDGQGR